MSVKASAEPPFKIIYPESLSIPTPSSEGLQHENVLTVGDGESEDGADLGDAIKEGVLDRVVRGECVVWKAKRGRRGCVGFWECIT